MSTEQAPATPTPAQPESPPKGEEFKAMSLEQFNKRLASERNAGINEVLSSLGVKDPSELKDLVESHRKEQANRLTEKQKLEMAVKELSPFKERAEKLDSTLKTYLDKRMGLLSEADRARVEKLAPKDPEARLLWIEEATAEKLIGSVVESAQSKVTEPVKPATTLAEAGPQTPKPAGTLTAYERWKSMVDSGKTFLAANYYQANRQKIEASRPK
ncbi:MAG: hypothetical protein E6Q97_36670 [Desulfurellales bacterium]|nr:MAG: hypothetical protein E6Q97_36670 [Desulfurellales bacterium]